MMNITKEEITRVLKELVAINSPYFGEEKIMRHVQSWFERQGMEAKLHQYHESKVTDFHGMNVLVELEGKKPGPAICLNGHLDTVQLCKGWTKNPQGEQEGDRLYGVGTLDMKSGCAANMIALKAFHENHPDFHGRIAASFVSVEEGPYGMGTNALIEEGYIKDVDISIITEPSCGFAGTPFPNICLGARGGYGLEIEFFGKSSHAALPEMGISAAEDAAAVVTELKNVSYIEDPHLGKGTACVVEIAADGGACSVPDYARVKLFWHIVVGENEETIRAEIEKAIERAGIRCRYQINFREAPSEASKGFLPYTVSENDPLVRTFMGSVENICGRQPDISYFQSIGDFNYLGSRLNGAPAILFGADGENFHGADEYVLLESVVQTACVVYDFLVQTLVFGV